VSVEPELQQRGAKFRHAAAQVVGTDPEPGSEPREAEEGEGACVAAPPCTAAAGGLREHPDPPAFPAHGALVRARPAADAPGDRLRGRRQPIAARAVALDQSARHQPGQGDA